jgi:hypothetical protein
LYLESDKTGPTASIKGNTIPADVNKYGTLEEGLYKAVFGHRNKSAYKNELALRIYNLDGTDKLPTVIGNPNPESDGKTLRGVLFHIGNKFRESLKDSRGTPYSEGCQTSHNEADAIKLHNAFFQILEIILKEIIIYKKKDMIKIFITCVFLMLFLKVNSQHNILKTKHPKTVFNLNNSKWSLKIAPFCTNTFYFKSHGSYIFYSGEIKEYYPGVYYIKKDTLFLREFYSDEDDAFSLLTREVKFTVLLKDKYLQPLYREDPVLNKNGEIKWIKTQLQEFRYKKK